MRTVSVEIEIEVPDVLEFNGLDCEMSEEQLVLNDIKVRLESTKFDGIAAKNKYSVESIKSREGIRKWD